MENTVHPKHCFCHIPKEELKKWAMKRYRDHYSTVELINSTDDPYEREVISIVALLDADEQTMLDMMGDVDKPGHHIIHCRENVRAIVNKLREAK